MTGTAYVTFWQEGPDQSDNSYLTISRLEYLPEIVPVVAFTKAALILLHFIRRSLDSFRTLLVNEILIRDLSNDVMVGVVAGGNVALAWSIGSVHPRKYTIEHHSTFDLEAWEFIVWLTLLAVTQYFVLFY